MFNSLAACAPTQRDQILLLVADMAGGTRAASAADFCFIQVDMPSKHSTLCWHNYFLYVSITMFAYVNYACVH